MRRKREEEGREGRGRRRREEKGEGKGTKVLEGSGRGSGNIVWKISSLQLVIICGTT